MSREIRRVALDFDAPLNEVWAGYITPREFYGPPCTACDMTGLTPARQWLDHIAHILTRLTEDIGVQADGKPFAHSLTQQYDAPSAWRVASREAKDAGRPWYTVFPEYVRPDPSWLELMAGFEIHPVVDTFFGGTRVDTYKVTAALLRVAGLPEKWGWCPTCDGDGAVHTPEQNAAREAWEATEPPAGEGWQLWSTTSEGTPKSPVFDTAEGLAQWMSTHPCGMAGAAYEYDAALRWITGPGWAPSMIGGPDGLVDGITAMTPAAD
jgi:hypothetical protein